MKRILIAAFIGLLPFFSLYSMEHSEKQKDTELYLYIIPSREDIGRQIQISVRHMPKGLGFDKLQRYVPSIVPDDGSLLEDKDLYCYMRRSLGYKLLLDPTIQSVVIQRKNKEESSIIACPPVKHPRKNHVIFDTRACALTSFPLGEKIFLDLKPMGPVKTAK